MRIGYFKIKVVCALFSKVGCLLGVFQKQISQNLVLMSQELSVTVLWRTAAVFEILIWC